jgi:hypothetical protein
VKAKNYWLLGTVIMVFLIGSYMFVNWIVGLCIISCTQDFFKFGDFTFEKFATDTYNYYLCLPKDYRDEPPQCSTDLFKGNVRAFYHGLVWAVWLAGLLLIILSAYRILSENRKILRST